MTGPSIHLLVLPDEDATVALGEALARLARPGDVIALKGPLGAGKTTLARGFVHEFIESEEEVVSPTFTLVQTYDGPNGTVWHFDLYRLEQPDEALELGIEEAFASGVSVIEWPERLGSLLPKHRLLVTLSMDGGSRVAALDGPSWNERLAAF